MRLFKDLKKIMRKYIIEFLESPIELKDLRPIYYRQLRLLYLLTEQMIFFQKKWDRKYKRMKSTIERYNELIKMQQKRYIKGDYE